MSEELVKVGQIWRGRKNIDETLLVVHAHDTGWFVSGKSDGKVVNGWIPEETLQKKWELLSDVPEQPSPFAVTDRAFRFLCGLNLQDHPVAEQRELLEIVRELKAALQPIKGAEALREAWKKTWPEVAKSYRLTLGDGGMQKRVEEMRLNHKRFAQLQAQGMAGEGLCDRCSKPTDRSISAPETPAYWRCSSCERSTSK